MNGAAPRQLPFLHRIDVMNKWPNFREMSDEALERVFRLYQEGSRLNADRDRSLCHRYLYMVYGEMERRKGKVRDEKGRNLYQS